MGCHAKSGVRGRPKSAARKQWESSKKPGEIWIAREKRGRAPKAPGRPKNPEISACKASAKHTWAKHPDTGKYHCRTKKRRGRPKGSKGTRASRGRAARANGSRDSDRAVNIGAWTALLRESGRSGSSGNGRDGTGASPMWREAQKLQEEKERRLAEELNARVQAFGEKIDECVTRIRQHDNVEDSVLKARYETESTRKKEDLLRRMEKKLAPKQKRDLTARLDVIRKQSWSTFQGERDALRRKVLDRVRHFNADLDKNLGRLKQSTWQSRVSASLKGKKTKEPRKEYDDIYEETKKAIIPEEASQLRRAFDRHLGQRLYGSRQNPVSHKEHTWRTTVEAMRRHERKERNKRPATDNPYLQSDIVNKMMREGQ